MSREGWPPPQPPGVHQTPEQPPGAAPRPMPSFGSAPPGQSTQPQPQSGPGPVLPPPSAPMFSSGGQQSGHNLPTLQGLTQPSPVIPSRPPPPTSEGPTGPQNSAQQQQGGQGPGYVLPNINEAVQGRSQGQSEFEREREIREQRREWDRTYQDEREHEQREREARDRQPQEAGPQHQTHAGSIPLHQPHAVAPQIRSAIHGPNGLLASVGPGPGSAPGPGPGPGPVPQTSSNLGAPSGPSNIFAGGPVQQTDGPQRMQMTQSQQQALMPFAAGPGAQSGAASVGQGQQPILNDALSYLDQVKVQFVDSPDVYNRFLDIMKDFKSGAIDTPGVIERVSTLFAGNPNLIQGFNTFLPPGYRIECGMGDDPNSIRVTTPMGTTVSSLPAPRPLSPRAVPPSSSVTGDVQYDAGARGASGGWPQQQNEAGPGGISMSPNGRMMGPLFMPHTQNQTSPVDTREQQIAANSATLAHQQEQRGVSQLQNAVTVAAGASMGGPGVQHLSPSGRAVTPQPHNINGVGPDGPPGAGLEKRGPVEFNHAISYVNKIKTRFASQPDIYKQFLEILQTYQRESKPIQDVYAQVTHLFNSAPDLLEDFKQFLPESAAHARAQAARQAAGGVMPEDVTMLSNLREPIYGTSQTPQMHQTPRVEQTKLPPMGNFAPTPSANKDNKRKRGAERQPPAASSSALAVATEPGPSAAARGGTGAASSVNKRTKYQHGAKLLDQRELHNVSPTLVPALPEPMAPGTSYAATQDELGLFDRVKKHIGNKNTMSEFLKLCNLFSQDLLSKGELVYRAYAYIGSSDDLMDGFKAFLKYDDKDTVVENRPRVMLDRPSLPNCRGLTPSYRLLPKREKMKVCSGRDELCHAVLNDEWASHPTWASEDSGFVAHRKNQYEETLHRIEEERHDYDFNIEALSRTVQLLTPYAQQLRNMTEQERKNMRLPEGLGGQSRTIHKRVIKKMYGREKGEVVCRGLAEEPSEVVPLLSNRLQAKLEEWKAAQREWDKIWREQTSKSFYRSLDHQWFAARQGDKRQFQMKTLQQEISVKWEEQQRARQMLYSNVPSFQLEFTHNDIDVILDTSSLLLTYAEYNHSTEVPRLVSFIKELLPLYFGFDQGKFQQSIQGRFESLAADDNLDEDQSVSDDVLARSRKTNRKKEDLRRGLLERGRSGRPARRDKEDSIAASSRGSSPEAVSAADDDPAGAPDIPAPKTEPVEDLAPEKWVEHPVDGNNFNMQNLRPEEPYKRDNYHLYANLSILCFFRMFFTLYERLKRLKDSEQAVHHTVDLAMGPKAAIDLNMIDKLPTNFFYEVGPTCNYYSQMLRMMSEQVQQEIEPSQVEETLRRYYLQCGYLLHQLEKLLSSLTRFAISIMANDGKDKSWDIIQLFKKDRVHEQTTHQDELNYRKQVEKYCKEGDIYRFNFDQVEMRTQIQIFKKDDATFNIDTMSAANRWTYYISSYTNIEPTEGVPVHLTHTAVLRKNLPDASDGVDTNMINGENMIEDADKSPNAATVAQAEASQRFTNIKSKEKLEMRICTRTYTPLFAPNSEDMLYHPHAFARRPVIHPTTETDGVNSGNKGMSGDIDGAGRAEGEDGDGETGDAEKAVEDVKEKLIMNNAWMKGLSKEQVDGYNEEYRQWKADANLTSGDDTEMAEG
ncbi:hypothetical protein EV356DRAFT_500937 [Viridothelium virens]|uniref:Histone deacetylase interacting domain-containing protein n=1 Tax=Viridothelium virens TaxID=1048519 RepID=A0A6A6HA54_VIRVR|nr:hypothetical protein EV356DRAFT_500937 [Viridothelium virens]